MFMVNPRLTDFWLNLSFFTWNWGSCYYLAPGMEKAFKRSLEKEELLTVFKRWLKK
jgi:hypothetical protein